MVMLVLGRSPGTAAAIAPGLAQVGEFSFILAVLGRSLDLLPEQGYQLIISAAIVSIALNPLLFGLAESLARRGGAEAQSETPVPESPE
jgi:K+:H+ antiporter